MIKNNNFNFQISRLSFKNYYKYKNIAFWLIYQNHILDCFNSKYLKSYNKKKYLTPYFIYNMEFKIKKKKISKTYLYLKNLKKLKK